MAEVLRYVVTVDAASGATLKVEQIGESGELTEVPAGASGHVCPPTIVFNLFVGQGGVALGTQPPAQGMGPWPAHGMGPWPGSGMGPWPGGGPKREPEKKG